MKNFLFSVALLLSASIAWGGNIKDTAAPVSIYTGSNTTPTINAATNGAVTIGPTGTNQAHTFNGTGIFQSTSAGTVDVTSTATNANASFRAKALGTGTPYFEWNKASAIKWQMQVDNTIGTDGLSFLSTGTTNVGGSSSVGAWTLGPASGGGNLVHTITSGARTTLVMSSAGTNSALFEPKAGGQTAIILGQEGSAGDLVTGSAAGDFIVRTASNGVDFSLDSGGTIKAKINPTGTLEANVRTDGAVGVGNVSSTASAGITMATSSTNITTASVTTSFCSRTGAIATCTVTFLATFTAIATNSVAAFSNLPFRTSGSFGAFGDAGGTCLTNGAGGVRATAWYVGASSGTNNLIVNALYSEENAQSRVTICHFSYKAS